jgi:hypothetical protein
MLFAGLQIAFQLDCARYRIEMFFKIKGRLTLRTIEAAVRRDAPPRSGE